MTRRPPSALAVLALTSFVSVLGCGPVPYDESAPPSPGSPSILHACEVFLRSDVDPNGLWGLRRMRNLFESPDGETWAKCAFGTEKKPIDFATLELRKLPSVARAMAAHRGSLRFLRRLNGQPLVPIAGVGDAAVWAGGRLDQLHAVAGDLILILTLEAGDEASKEARATSAATQAFARLAARALPAPAPPVAPPLESPGP